MTKACKQWEGQVVNAPAQGCDFQLLQYLGGSKRSAVFLTEWGAELQRAAIKLVAADSADADAQLSQWQRTIKLSHPHLLRLFQAGRCLIESTELLFVVMEYAEEDLSQILPERPLTPAETREMLRPALDALVYLHGQGLVHSRLKPANIMAIRDQLKLATDGLYATGERVAAQGRSPYDPPEISASSESANGGISPAADVWSLGITLVEVLTQRLPASNETEHADPAVPQHLPKPFLEIVRNCLRKDPQQRWTIADVAARLDPPVAAALQPGDIKEKSLIKQEAPVKQKEIKVRKASAKWLFIVPAIAATFAGVLLAGSRILHRQQPAEPQEQTQLREDAQEAEKPSPGSPLKSGRGKSQEPSNAPHASPLPAAPSQPESSAVASGPQHEGIVQQVLPTVPQKARDTIWGKVRVKVRVHVDALGNVADAELDSPGRSPYFAQLALQAAQRWKFTPAQAGRGDTEREWILRFEFGNDQTRVYPSPITDAPIAHGP